MKILLLGEFSGFYKNLKTGLEHKGHQVTHAFQEMDWKKISFSDIKIPLRKLSLSSIFEHLYFYFFGIKRLFGYDVVLIINPIIFGITFLNYNGHLIERIKRHSKKLYLTVCGHDYYVYQAHKSLRYNSYEDRIEIDNKGFNPYISKQYKNNNDFIVHLVNGIIPVMYTYKLAYSWSIKTHESIPLPITTTDYLYTKNIVNKKVVIFHGINKFGYKGSKYIIEAMRKIKNDFPELVEIVIVEKLPFNLYLKELEKVNIVIDQALSYEYGMNAIIAMALGKVVLSGNEPESMKEFNRFDIPVINILPDVNDIYNKLSEIIISPEMITSIGQKSRMFVEQFHDSNLISQLYLNLWTSIKEKI